MPKEIWIINVIVVLAFIAIVYGIIKTIVDRRNRSYYTDDESMEYIENERPEYYAEQQTEQQPEQRTERRGGGASSIGVFFAVLLAILAAIWLIPRLFEFTVTITPLK